MIYIVRQGETNYNLEGRYCGRVDVELNAKEIEQAHIIHNELNNVKFNNEKIKQLQEYKNIYVIGHNNMDFDSYFSSYILSNILKNLNINAKFTILDDYIFCDENKEIINDYKKESPIILNRKEINNKNFILVDHNDIEQSLKNNNCNIILAIDHHIDSKKVKECYSVEYTSTLLYIYDLFRNIYKFN